MTVPKFCLKVVFLVERGPEVSPPEQTVPEGDPATMRCWVEGHPEAELAWKRADGSPLPFGAEDRDGVLSIDSTLKSDEGDYVCTYSPPGDKPKDSTPSRLNVKTRKFSFLNSVVYVVSGSSKE